MCPRGVSRERVGGGLARVDWLLIRGVRIMGLGANRTLAVVETDWSITHWQVGRRGLDESQLRRLNQRAE